MMTRIATGTIILCVLSLAILPAGCAPATGGRAEPTLAELVAAEQEANQLVHDLGFPFSTAVDAEGNRVVLWVTDREQFEAALRNAGRRLPEHVELVVVHQPPVHTPAGITPVPDVAFPQLRARSTVHFDLSPLQGTLLVEDGCLSRSRQFTDCALSRRHYPYLVHRRLLDAELPAQFAQADGVLALGFLKLLKG